MSVTVDPRPDTPRDRRIRRCVWSGMGLNAVLMLVKLAVGVLAHSRALVTDALNSFSDFGTDAVILLGSRYWSRPPDPRHPYGHGRIETLVSALVGGVLAVAGLAMGWGALRALVDGVARPAPGWSAFGVALATVGAKEWLYRWTLAVGRRTHSLALQANAWNHRSDVWISISVAAVVGAARIVPSWSFLDSAGALVVALLLMQAAYRIVRPALGELLDEGTQALTADIEALARGVAGVRGVHAIRTRRAGSKLLVDLHVLVDPLTSVRDGHAITSRVCDALHAHATSIIEVLIHLEPCE